MMRNTRDLIHKLKIALGGLTVLTAGVLGVFVTKRLRGRKKYHRDFDPDSVEKITGNITEVSSSADNEHSVHGVVIWVAFGEENIPMHLGPGWFINRQFKRFKAGEKITATGSRIQYDGQDILVAETLKRNKETYRLRDETGSPYWDTRVT